MNQPWVYMCSPSWSPLSPPSPSSGSLQCTSPECPVSCIEPGLMVYFTYGNIHVSMLFSQIIPPLLSPTESQSLFFISVSLLLSRIQGCCYHLSKFHIYALIYCIGVFLCDLLQSNSNLSITINRLVKIWNMGWCFSLNFIEESLSIGNDVIFSLGCVIS